MSENLKLKQIIKGFLLARLWGNKLGIGGGELIRMGLNELLRVQSLKAIATLRYGQ